MLSYIKRIPAQISVSCPLIPEAVSRGCSQKTGILKICSKFTGEYPCGSEFQESCKVTLLRLHFRMGVALQISDIIPLSYSLLIRKF